MAGLRAGVLAGPVPAVLKLVYERWVVKSDSNTVLSLAVRHIASKAYSIEVAYLTNTLYFNSFL